jgi:Fur family ferric uptake transcriptional regulator
MTVEDLLIETLKKNSLSLTKPRQLIFNALNTSKPLTISELVNKTSEQIDRASVYRTLAAFEEANITQRIYNGWKYKVELSDKFQDHHHHLTCQNCGIIIPIHDRELEKTITNLAAKKDFKINSHQLEIQGLCSDCKKLKKFN